MIVDCEFTRKAGFTKDFIPKEHPHYSGYYIVPNFPKMLISKNGDLLFQTENFGLFCKRNWRTLNNSYNGIEYQYWNKEHNKKHRILINKLTIMAMMFLEKPDNFMQCSIVLKDKFKPITLDNIEFISESKNIDRKIYTKDGVHTFMFKDFNVPDGYSPKLHPLYDGFYIIPGFRNYCINPNTLEILSTLRKNTRKLNWSVSHEGYRKIAMVSDDGRKVTISRHRILALMFLRHTINGNPGKYIVNHKDGVPGHDFLPNLELISPMANVQHAMKLNHKPFHIRTQIRYVDTGKVMTFDSAIECAKHLNLSRDQILKRLNTGPTRVFPERIQYRNASIDAMLNAPWPQIDDIEQAIDEKAHKKRVLVKNCMTGEISKYETSKDAQVALNIAPATISIWLSDKEQLVRVLPDFSMVAQFKYAHDGNEFRPIDDIYEEITKSNKLFKMIIVNDTKENKTYIYPNASACAKAYNLLTTTLNWRLQKGGIYDGRYEFRYYKKGEPSKSFIHWC